MEDLTMIKTEDQAIQFLTTLQYLYPLFHPDDDPMDVVNDNGYKEFNDEQCEYLSKRLDEVYNILSDPCDVVYNQIRPKMEMWSFCYNNKNK